MRLYGSVNCHSLTNTFKSHFTVCSITGHYHRHEIGQRASSSKGSISICIPTDCFTNFTQNYFLNTYLCACSFVGVHAIIYQNSKQFSEHCFFISPSIQLIKKPVCCSSWCCQDRKSVV